MLILGRAVIAALMLFFAGFVSTLARADWINLTGAI